MGRTYHRRGGDPVKKNATVVNRYLASRIRGNPRILYEAASHLIRSGGKRLRPFMVVKSCQAFGGSQSSAMFAAGAVEMIHNFTLIHDDIMDRDEVRHGVPTVHKRHGEALAILAGDVLFSKAFQIASRSDIPPRNLNGLLARLADACVEVCEGQVLDIEMARSKRIPTRAQYNTMIDKKTAALFDVSCAMGAICAGASEESTLDVAEFGRNFGMAFQITDDLIGVTGDPEITKKPVGNDLREGKKSLPIVEAIGAAGRDDRRAIMRCFGNPRAGKRDLREAVEIIRDLGIDNKIRRRASRYAWRAQRCLEFYDGDAKDEMLSLLEFVVRRSA